MMRGGPFELTGIGFLRGAVLRNVGTGGGREGWWEPCAYPGRLA
jgi:hypothetical protein